MSKKRNGGKEYSMHHWCPRSRHGQTNDINCEMIKENTHQAIHQVFSNDIFPEQIVRLTNMTSKALKAEVVQEIMNLFEYKNIHDPEEWYKEECIRLSKHNIYFP